MIIAAPLLAVTAAAAIVYATFLDTSLGAAIAGIFSMINTVLTSWLAARQRRTHREVQRTQALLKAPRTAVYNEHGRIVGTMLKLHDSNEFWPATRADDPPPLPEHEP